MARGRGHMLILRESEVKEVRRVMGRLIREYGRVAVKHTDEDMRMELQAYLRTLALFWNNWAEWMYFTSWSINIANGLKLISCCSVVVILVADRKSSWTQGVSQKWKTGRIAKAPLTQLEPLLGWPLASWTWQMWPDGYSSGLWQ